MKTSWQNLSENVSVPFPRLSQPFHVLTHWNCPGVFSFFKWYLAKRKQKVKIISTLPSEPGIAKYVHSGDNIRCWLCWGGDVAAEHRNSKLGDVYKTNTSRTLLPPKYPVSITFNFHIIQWYKLSRCQLTPYSWKLGAFSKFKQTFGMFLSLFWMYHLQEGKVLAISTIWRWNAYACRWHEIAS